MQLSYLENLSSNIQTQINSKQPTIDASVDVYGRNISGDSINIRSNLNVNGINISATTLSNLQYMNILGSTLTTTSLTIHDQIEAAAFGFTGTNSFLQFPTYTGTGSPLSNHFTHRAYVDAQVATKASLSDVQSASYNWTGSHIFTQGITINGASIFLNTSPTIPGSEIRSVYNGTDSDLFLCTGAGGTEIKRLGVYANGVVNLNSNNQIWNKLLCLYDLNSTDSPTSTTNFFGLGINSYVMRYQVPTTTSSHIFYGSTQRYATMDNTGMNINGDILGTNIKASNFVQNLNNIFSWCNII
jgi:hypothetical protein